MNKEMIEVPKAWMDRLLELNARTGGMAISMDYTLEDNCQWKSDIDYLIGYISSYKYILAMPKSRPNPMDSGMESISSAPKGKPKKK